MEQTINAVQLRGVVQSEPTLSHETYDQTFFTFPLEVLRLSGQPDQLPVLVRREDLNGLMPLAGKSVAITGQMRSFNNKSGTGPRLVVSVLARTLIPDDAPDENLVHLKGVLCKSPVLRRTPLGRLICDMMLAVNRRYGRADYIPCIAWGQIAARSGALSVGSGLELLGRMQSRTYSKLLPDGSTQERTAYEVSVMELCDEQEN